MKRIISAFYNSVAGFRHLVRHEAAFKEECILFVVALPIAWWIAPTVTQFLLLMSVIGLIMIVEVLNTAIESVCDALTTEFDANVKVAKDAGSLAVLMAAVIAIFVWLSAILAFLVR
ncbi:MAG: diacylglycerol kinase [Pseudomonadota bacterium]